MKGKYDYDIVLVEWIDSASNDYWESLDINELSPIKCTSVGYLIEENVGYILLAQSINEEKQACCRIAIPRDCIQTIKTIPINKKKDNE